MQGQSQRYNYLSENLNKIWLFAHLIVPLQKI